jgi:hypothetical protein
MGVLLGGVVFVGTAVFVRVAVEVEVGGTAVGVAVPPPGLVMRLNWATELYGLRSKK